MRTLVPGRRTHLESVDSVPADLSGTEMVYLDFLYTEASSVKGPFT